MLSNTKDTKGTIINGSRVALDRGRVKSVLLTLAATLALTLLIACGGDKENFKPAPPVVTIAISPDKANVEAGKSVQITVTSTGGTDIIWPKMTGGAGVEGEYTPINNLAIYTPPPVAGTYDFTVKAKADTTKTATAKITVIYANPTISITPLNATILQGATQKFEANAVFPEYPDLPYKG